MNIEKRIENELESVKEGENLYTFAVRLKEEGLSQNEIRLLFNSAREKHSKDKNEIKYNAILDTMDYIVGWCSPVNQIFKN